MLVHWRAQCHTKWPRHSKRFHHQCGIKPEPSDSLWLTLTTKLWVHVTLQKKMVYIIKFFAACNNFFECRIVILRLLRSNIKARHQKIWILERKPLIDTSFCIQHGLSWNIFTLHNFCSKLMGQLIDLEKVRLWTENLKFRMKFRTYLWDWAVDGWSVTQQMIVYNDKLLKNLKIKIEAHPVNAGHLYMAFKHHISYATYLAAYFWWQLIQNHVRHHFQAFTRSHVK